MTNRRATILVADTREGIETLQSIFSSVASCLTATTMEQARACLDMQPDLVICGIHFDDSRMFDFLRTVTGHSTSSDVPFLGYRDLDSDIGAAVLEGLDIACKALGGAAFIDLHTLRFRKGVIEADSELRSIALSFIDQG